MLYYLVIVGSMWSVEMENIVQSNENTHTCANASSAGKVFVL